VVVAEWYLLVVLSRPRIFARLQLHFVFPLRFDVILSYHCFIVACSHLWSFLARAAPLSWPQRCALCFYDFLVVLVLLSVSCRDGASILFLQYFFFGFPHLLRWFLSLYFFFYFFGTLLRYRFVCPIFPLLMFFTFLAI